MQSNRPALVVMGVSGCGKSSAAAAIAGAIGGRMIEGDTYHPPENVEKMRNGIPLDDEDRAGWLDRLAGILAEDVARGEIPVLACSALKARYRNVLRGATPGLGFVFLELTREAAFERVGHRPGHYMPSSLVDSQFAALEPPVEEEGVLTVDATRPLADIVENTRAWLSGGR